MNDSVTVKKNRRHPAFFIVFFIAGASLYFVSTEVTKKYLLARSLDDITTWGRIGYFTLCFVMYLVTIVMISYAITELSLWILDHDRYVVIRKRALENSEAMRIHEEYRKKVRRISIINEAITYILLVTLMMLYILKGGSWSQFFILVWILCFILALNPISSSLRRKEEAKRRKILLEDCDPLLSYDVYELYRMEVLAKPLRNQTLFYQAIASYYLGDYEEMERKLTGIAGVRMPQIQGGRILLLGLAALDQGRQDLFQKYSQELYQLESAPRQLEVTRKYYQQIRRDWQGRIDLSGPDPSRALPYVQKELETGKHPLFWMDSTYQLAWIQLSQEEKERAKENLLLVVERAGTMAIREKAKKLLDVV